MVVLFLGLPIFFRALTGVYFLHRCYMVDGMSYRDRVVGKVKICDTLCWVK